MKKLVFTVECVVFALLFSLVILIGMTDQGKIHLLTNQTMKNAFIALMLLQVWLMLIPYFKSKTRFNTFFKRRSKLFNVLLLGIPGLLMVKYR